MTTQNYLQEQTFFVNDVGVIIDAFLSLQGANPAGATVTLLLKGLPSKAMTWDANAQHATYTVQVGDFTVGRWEAQVKFVNGAVTLHSDIFVINVKAVVA